MMYMCVCVFSSTLNKKLTQYLKNMYIYSYWSYLQTILFADISFYYLSQARL